MNDTIDEQVERAAFEAWYSPENLRAYGRNSDGDYRMIQVHTSWIAWLACARTKAAEIADWKANANGMLKAGEYWKAHYKTSQAEVATLCAENESLRATVAEQATLLEVVGKSAQDYRRMLHEQAERLEAQRAAIQAQEEAKAKAQAEKLAEEARASIRAEEQAIARAAANAEAIQKPGEFERRATEFGSSLPVIEKAEPLGSFANDEPMTPAAVRPGATMTLGQINARIAPLAITGVEADRTLVLFSHTPAPTAGRWAGAIVNDEKMIACGLKCRTPDACAFYTQCFGNVTQPDELTQLRAEIAAKDARITELERLAPSCNRIATTKLEQLQSEGWAINGYALWRDGKRAIIDGFGYVRFLDGAQLAARGEVTLKQFQATDGTWHSFIDERHEERTIAPKPQGEK